MSTARIQLGLEQNPRLCEGWVGVTCSSPSALGPAAGTSSVLVFHLLWELLSSGVSAANRFHSEFVFWSHSRKNQALKSDRGNADPYKCAF